MAHILGAMERNIKDIGEIIKCTEKVNYGGQMEKFMLVNFKKIKDMVLVNLGGKMEENMKASGLKANSMDQVFIETLKEKKEKAHGLMAKENVGWIDRTNITKTVQLFFRLNINI